LSIEPSAEIQAANDLSSPEVLVVMAHPALERSRANRVLMRSAQAAPGVALRDLYELYPDFAVDVSAEQEALREASAVVLQYPIYWYSPPALMKEWLDLVWLHGFAYGRGGEALKGKRLLVACTTGGGPESYDPKGMHGYPFEMFLKPMKQTAVLCGMTWERPFVVHGAAVKSAAALASEAERYRKRLCSLSAKCGAQGASGGPE
jgi:glutathione-regulated potassium-efflux system ancillary protein KefG